MIALTLWIILQTLIAFLIGTLFFDIFHYLSHQFLKSKYTFLRKIGHLHNAHHQFFSSSLEIREKYIKKNFLQHILIEYAVHLCGILFCLLFLNPLAIWIALVCETSLFLFVCYKRGIDPHHRPYTFLPSYRGGFYATAEYHALHHIYPNNFFSSYIKIIDWVLGTGNQLKGKHIAMTGANGALGSHMKILLEKEGALVNCFKYGEDYTYENYQKLEKTLKNTDILFLCHGSKYENAQQANCDSFVKIIELFRATHQRKLVPLEIWGVGSEIECHPCFGIKKLKVYANSKRNYARYAKIYFHDKDIQYRHLVHSAFMSKMGPGLMSANFAATATLFLLKRGFKYVPVTYTGIAFLNYFRFIK